MLYRGDPLIESGTIMQFVDVSDFVRWKAYRPINSGSHKVSMYVTY